MDCFQSRSKWCYRGEGNATLVISNQETQEVLRLRKVPVKPKGSGEPVDDRSHEITRNELTQNVDFCKEIFVPLLSERYVHPGVVVDLPEDFTTRMNHLITSANGERPLHRLTKEVSANCKLGVLMPDFCFISDGDQSDFARSKPSPTFCVEIKPKCGILSNYGDRDVQNSVYNEVKQSICKYCLLQWQKVNKEGKYPQRSEYCPVDLFSMDAKRVLYALKCLLKDPQNNLRIFRDGKLVYSGERNLHVPSQSLASAGNTSPVNKIPPSNGTCMIHNRQLSELEDVLKSSFITDCTEAVSVGNLFSETDGTTFNYTTIFMVTLLQLLVDDSKKYTIDANHPMSKTPVCAESNYNESTLLKNDDLQSFLMSPEVTFCKGGVLNKILNGQRLDKLGSDEVFKIYKDVCNNGNVTNILQNNNFTLNYNVGDSEDGVVTKHVALKYFDENLSQPKASHASSEEELSISCKLGNLARFLVAASANDCSIMISFQQVDEAPTDSTCYFKEAITGVYYKYSIAAVDLDPKNINRIPKYYHDYHEIIENYLLFSKNML